MQCYNGGKCNPNHGSSDGVQDVCLCPPGYRETGCTTKAVSCPGGSWCTNGGTCAGGALCSCPLGYSGGHCQIQVEMDTCTGSNAGHRCLNGGKCTVDPASPCKCPDGFGGALCEKTVTRCIGGHYCENGGTCSSTACDCPTGFEGSRCHVLTQSTATTAVDSGKGKGALADGDKRLAAIVAVPLVFVVVGLGSFTIYLVRRERRGDPMFSKLDDDATQGGGGGGGPGQVEVQSVVRTTV